VDEMASIELGADRNSQLQPPHRRFGRRPVRDRSDKIAAEPDENLGASVDHRLNGVDDMVPASPWRLEAKYLFYLVEEFRLWLFVDAHRAVALHVRMAAHRADPRSRLADIAAQQQQVHSLLHFCGAEPMLRDPHAVADNNGLRPHVDIRHTLQLVARQTADTQYVVPAHVAEIVGEGLEAVGMLRDEIDIEY